MHPSEADKLERFMAERGRPLLAAAKLLTGSQEAAEDLLQAALERLIRHWSGIEGDPEGYLRRTGVVGLSGRKFSISPEPQASPGVVGR